jgi:DNA-directed RNA polymerase subunit RPC12/RpoP
MPHKVFIRHTYIYKCGDDVCGEEWKINEASKLEKLRCPHCGKYDSVEYVDTDQRTKYNRRGIGL